jgi:polar amino acid transport system permease protein
MSFLEILEQLAQGLGHTLVVTLTCSVTALLVGLIMTCLRQLGAKHIAGVLDVFTYVFRGILTLPPKNVLLS